VSDRIVRAGWPTRLRRIALLVASLSLVASAAAVAAPAAPGVAAAPPGAEVVPDSYIVVLDSGHPSAVARQHVQQHGAEISHVYQHAVQGYAATMSPRAAQAIARDPRVVRVEPETVESIQSQTLPTGVDRVETDRNPTVSTDGSGDDLVDIPVAVIDTGVADHPDLNIGGRVDCTVRSGGGPFASYSCVEGQGDDDNGHGTHVAGTIAAIDSGDGVVGVAPGAPVWSVKVCPTNSCPSGAIIAGIDWVTGQKASGAVDFAAANFSISSADSSNSCANPANTTHEAICGLVDEGVSFVMAAGNDGRLKVPYPVGFSVSAIADFDGVAGGEGAPTCRDDQDDTLANFSNHGDGVRIAAPGVCILSTWPGGGYNSISGTSMAAPHVAGAVALYLHANGQAPAQNAAGVLAIEDAIIGAAHPQGTDIHVCSYDDSRTGGPLLFVNAAAFGGAGSCGVAGDDDGGTDPDPDPEGPTASFTDACDELSCTFDASDSSGDGLSFAWTFGDGGEANGEVVHHTYADGGTYTVELIVTDAEGETDSSTRQITVEESDDEGDISLEAEGYKVRGLQKADLAWSGTSTSQVDILRDGAVVATIDDAGAYTDDIDVRGGGSYTYQVCEAGTDTCSSEVTVTY
jgi:subtilisin